MKERANNSAWFIAIEGIVVEAAINDGIPQIKAKVDIIHDEFVHDEWITAMMAWVGTDGYGPVNLPAVGTEVLIFGRLGQKHTLFYLSRYNEEFRAPEGFEDAFGFQETRKYRALTDEDIEIASGKTALLRGEQEAHIDSPLVLLRNLGGAEGLRTEGAKLGVLGASAIARQTLPPAATNLVTCITLANAMRQMLIQFGFAQ